MIYTKNGDALTSPYNVSGNAITEAYNLSGVNVLRKLKIMTYNVGQWYIGTGTNVPSADDEFYYDLQNGMIANNDPDILCIEEYWKIFSKAGRTALSLMEQYYPYIYEQGGDSGYFGRCVCSKYPISNYTTHYYSNDANRYYDSCNITAAGKDITILVTHLGLTATARAPQITELITFLNSLDTFFCCGDYNTPSDYSETMPSATELVPFTDAGFKMANCSDTGEFITSSGQPSSTWRGWIDNIVTSSDVDILSASVDETKISLAVAETIPKIDHMPFMAEVLI